MVKNQNNDNENKGEHMKMKVEIHKIQRIQYILTILCCFLLVPFYVKANVSVNVNVKNSVSLYENKSEWQTQESDILKLEKFKGSYVVIGMIYTNCAYACPLTISKLQEIEKNFKIEKIQNYKFLLATFDTKKDKPEHLKKYLIEKGLDSKIWTFLYSAKESVVRELSVLLGISYQDLGDGDFNHSNVLTLLDPFGHVIYRIDNYNTDLKQFAEMIKKDLSVSGNKK